jgi:CubicO group peptidase (beta-lactamase class C family)
MPGMDRLLTLLAAAFLLAACQPSQEETIAARVDDIVHSQVDNKKFTGSVLVAKGDHILFNKSYGLANVEWNIPNTPTTKFRIGSVTKQFTAAAILLLAQQGKLKLEDPVKTHWPEAPRSWDKITIFHLLTHTSGIPDGLSVEWETQKVNETSAEKTLNRVRHKPLDFEPGNQFRYSNYGFILLGYLIERISGQTYAEFLGKQIFTPLGMKDSGADSNSAIIPMRAAGYSPGPDGLVNADYVNMTFPHAAGVLYSTTEDLLRWTQGLFGGKLLSATLLEQMTTPFKDNYGFGVGVVHKKGLTMISHSGGIDGFNSNLSYFVEEKITIAVLSNLRKTSEDSAPDVIANQVSAILHGETLVLPSDRQEIKLSEEVLTKLTGLYEFDPNRNMIVTLSNGNLSAQVGTNPSVEIFPESPTHFFGRSVDEQVEFEKDSQGNVSALVLHLEGEQHRARRLADRSEIRLPAEVLNRYSGTYPIEPGFDVVISVEEDRLMAVVGEPPKVQLHAESETRFFMKEGNIQIEFILNKAGQTTGIIAHHGGEETRAPRK